MWVAENEFDGKAADLKISAAEGVKEGDVGREPRAREM